MKKILQKYDEAYLEKCRQMSPTAAIQFLEDYRNLVLRPNCLRLRKAS